VVEELLQLDTQAALHAARQNVIGSMTVPGPVTSLSSENILLAIYGVGQSLTAEVLLETEKHVFKNLRKKRFWVDLLFIPLSVLLHLAFI